MPQSAGPGDVLAERYLLVDLLTESGNGRFWRAHDRVLQRHVALHCLAEDDERAADLMEAARLSATVHDRRLLRVLDADRRDGLAYVVHEWGSGSSLDILVGNEGPLPPRRAAWIVSEVATALAGAHEQRVAHGRLVPENVLVDQTGQVRIIGFCVDAALLGVDRGQLSGDVADLGGLLYFLLTGRWAGQSDSGVPEAMRDHGRWLRPRQVRAGIPRVLDSVCDQVLNPWEAEGPGSATANLHTARGLADTLVEYVGDPTGLVQPAPVGGITGGVLAVPERRRHEPAPPDDASPATEPTQVVPTVPEPDPEPDPEPEPEPEPEHTIAFAPPPVVPPEPEAVSPDPQGPLSAPADPGDMPTQAGMPIFDDEVDDVSWLERRSEPPPPPPAFEDPPERPLFAPEPADGGPARQPRPGAAPAQTGDYWPWENSGAGTGSGIIPVAEDDDEEAEEVPGRSWFRLALIIAVSLLLLVGVVIAYNLGRGKTLLGAEPEPDTPSGSAGTPSPTLAPIEGLAATDLDPQGDPPEEYPELAPLAVDGDDTTVWRTETYFDQLGPPPGLKTGVGIVVDLGSSQEISQIDLTTVGGPGEITYFLSDEEPTAVAGLEPLETTTTEDGRTRTRLDEPATGQYLVVWFTALPAVDGGFRGEIAEVGVSG